MTTAETPHRIDWPYITSLAQAQRSRELTPSEIADALALATLTGDPSAAQIAARRRHLTALGIDGIASFTRAFKVLEPDIRPR